MEKIKSKLVFAIVVFNFCNVLAQNEIVDTGLISTKLTLTPSVLLQQKESTFYVHGAGTYYLSPKVSIDGEGYYQLGKISSENPTFEFNHNLFFGAARHFTANDNDFYLGLQPGVSIAKVSKEISNLEKRNVGVNPVASITAGYNFYVNSYFHFFFQTRYIAGSHKYDMAQSLSEFRFSAGLGLNLRTIKNKK